MHRGAAMGQNVQSSTGRQCTYIRGQCATVVFACAPAHAHDLPHALPPAARRGLPWPLLAVLLAGCDTVVMNPSGDIAAQQGHLIVVSTVLMLLIIVPVIALTLLFAWRYRAVQHRGRPTSPTGTTRPSSNW